MFTFPLFNNKNNMTDAVKNYVDNLHEHLTSQLDDSEIKETIIEETEKHKWITVEGYKGFYKQLIPTTDENGNTVNRVTLCGRNNFVYNIDKPTCITPNEDENKLSPCNSGLHFCLNLKDVFSYYNVLNAVSYNTSYSSLSDMVYIIPTVFCKIEAEVDEKDFNLSVANGSTKFVARKITIKEFIPYEELWDAYITHDNEHDNKEDIIKTYPSFSLNKNTIYLNKDVFVYLKNAINQCVNDNLYTSKTTITQLNSIISNAVNKSLTIAQRKIYNDQKKNRVNHLVELDYSETFASILMEQYFNKYELACTFAEEGISKDMRAYLLLK